MGTPVAKPLEGVFDFRFRWPLYFPVLKREQSPISIMFCFQCNNVYPVISPFDLWTCIVRNAIQWKWFSDYARRAFIVSSLERKLQWHSLNSDREIGVVWEANGKVHRKCPANGTAINELTFVESTKCSSANRCLTLYGENDHVTHCLRLVRRAQAQARSDEGIRKRSKLILKC